MLQQPEPEDFVIATGKQYSVRQFVDAAAGELGVTLEWKGKGAKEVGLVASVKRGSPAKALKKGSRIVAVDPRYFRPTEVDTLLGDPSKARKKLGWVAKTSFKQLVKEMAAWDLTEAKRDALVTEHGYTALNQHE